jgi:hypothetical protein
MNAPEPTARQFTAYAAACLIGDGADFVTRPVEVLVLDFAGIVGDLHAGFTRPAGVREPWHPRGTEIRHGRQLTIVSSIELAEVAAAMDIPEILPEWIGANLVFADIPDLSLLPPGTRLLFGEGAALMIEGDNAPCRSAGKSIGRHYPDRDGLDLAFPKYGRNKRGLVASVEKPGIIRTGALASLRIPVHRLYPPVE